jgi:predicted small metal-binding protein
MGYIVYCRDAGLDCDTVVAGETPEEILMKVRSHATDEHDVVLTPVMADLVRTLLKGV